MLEFLGFSEKVNVEGLEHLAAVKELNQFGRQCIFAPNHLKPESWWRVQSALAEDYPQLESVLRTHGLRSTVVFRGDSNIPAGEPGEMRSLYRLHSHIQSYIGHLLTGGLPLNTNETSPEYAMRRNRANILRILETSKRKNLAIYPYGNWFPSGEQTFEEERDLDLVNKGFVSIQDFEHWRTALKEGFFNLAKKTHSPIVPTYAEYANSEWLFRFGAPIEPDGEAIELAKKYLAAMRALKDQGA